MSTTLLVGDTHANLAWWTDVVEPTALEVGADRIVQVGDFGYWPMTAAFIDTVANSCVPVWFIDGNHENHRMLRNEVDTMMSLETDPSGLVNLTGDLWFWPRGLVVEFDGVKIMGMGGAHSIDRGVRTKGVSWFPEEHITDDEMSAAADAGPVDVLVCHDAPSGWQVPGIGPNVPPLWAAELTACEEHRGRLRRVMENATPRVVVHGHYHVGYVVTHGEAWGPVETWGLGRDGDVRGLAVLTTGPGLARVDSIPSAV